MPAGLNVFVPGSYSSADWSVFPDASTPPATRTRPSTSRTAKWLSRTVDMGPGLLGAPKAFVPGS